MNGIHDIGGMQDMGPIRPTKSEPVFHAPWEGRVYAMWMAVPADWSISADRFQKELMPPLDYLRMSYYEKIMTGLIDLMLKTQMITEAEIQRGKAVAPAAKTTHALKASEVASTVAKGSTSRRNVPAVSRFHAGQRVRARNINPLGHTRLPRYARGKIGTVQRDHGVFVFSDTDAQGLGEKPQHVYSVRFDARELWGEHASERDAVYIDVGRLS